MDRHHGLQVGAVARQFEHVAAPEAESDDGRPIGANVLDVCKVSEDRAHIGDDGFSPEFGDQ